MNGYTLVTGTTVAVVATTAAKLHLRVDSTADDSLIASLVTVATDALETEQNRHLLTKTYDLTLDDFPASDTIALDLRPLVSVTSVTYLDSNSSSQTLASTAYIVDTKSEQGRITLGEGQTWPTTDARINTVTVRFVVGESSVASGVPEMDKHWIKLMVGHLYENREAVNMVEPAFVVPATLDRLSKPFLRF